MEKFLEKAKKASTILLNLSGSKRDAVLRSMAEAIRANTMSIIEANAKDLENAKTMNLSSAMLERLMLDEKRIEAMAKSVEEIAALRDPVGRVLDGWVNENGLKIEKVSIPIGVVAIIYESRPNVTSDVAALCFKSSNGCVLKGGKEAIESNTIIAEILQQVLVANGLPKELISLLPDSSREGVAKLLKMDKYVDLIVPRGGEELVRYISANSTIPVVKHDKGMCHIYVHRKADIEDALNIVINAKTQRPGVCNAMETMIVDEAIANQFLPMAKERFDRANTRLKGCDKTRESISVERASEEDFNTEYLENILNIKVVDGVDGAIEHIRRYGSGHSESIITRDISVAEYFLNSVDSACVYVNASTRFTDGGVFGFGAEVGISTNKLHARGPMGVDGLTTYKYKIYGDGQIR